MVSLGQLALVAALAVEIAQVVVGDDTVVSVAASTHAVLFPGVLANATTAAKTTTARVLDALSETVGKLFVAFAANSSSEADAVQLGYNGSSTFDNGAGGGGGGGSSTFSRLVLNATGQVFENEFINGSGSISGSTHAGTSINSSYNESYSEMPQIPEYIRATSMVFCIIIMCLGVIGNIMVCMYIGIS